MRYIHLMAALIALSACAQNRVVTSLRPDLTNPARFECTPALPADRPIIAPEDPVDWSRVEAAPSVPSAVAIAKEEHNAFVGAIRSREGAISRYIIKVEGLLFTCSANAQWVRDYYAGLPK